MPVALHEMSRITEERFTRFRTRPLTGTFGARVEGIQIAEAIDDDELFAELRAAWVKYQALFFRDQELTPQQHLALGSASARCRRRASSRAPMARQGCGCRSTRRCTKGRSATSTGTRTARSGRTRPAGRCSTPSMFPKARATRCGPTCTLPTRTCRSPGSACSMASPPSTTTPPRVCTGCSTRWAVGLLAMRAQLPPTEQPVVATHPETGRRMLFVSELMTREIVGMSERESRAVLDFLFAHQTRPEFQCRFHWRPGPWPCGTTTPRSIAASSTSAWRIG
jgi:taurine dioxygenase